MNRITYFLGKIKQAWEATFLRVGNILKNEDIFVILVIIFVGFGGFGLGRLSLIQEEKTPVTIKSETPSQGGESDSKKIADNDNIENRFIASSKGSKYHLPWCPGAERIKEENKIWFASEEDAQRAGYTPAGNCKGL